MIASSYSTDVKWSRLLCECHVNSQDQAKMVNKCELVYCRTGKVPSSDGEKISTFHLPIDDPEICDKWKYFVGSDVGRRTSDVGRHDTLGLTSHITIDITM